MVMSPLEQAIVERGRRIFQLIGDSKPSIFSGASWTGKMMDWAMRNEPFKLQLFRFIDVLPCISSDESLQRHLEEYFLGQDVPAAIRLGLKGASAGGRLGMKVAGAAIRHNVEAMARQFIIASGAEETIKALEGLRKEGFAVTLDLLGETTVSEAEADRHRDSYLHMLDDLGKAQSSWPALGGKGASANLDWSCQPRINVSIKPSALYSQVEPADFEGSVRGILERVRPVYRKVIEAEGFLCIDMEARSHKDIALEVYRRLRNDRELRHWPHLGVAIQAYLKESEADVEGLLRWSAGQGLPISIRLVKGAYWDYEVAIARLNGWPIPVFTEKAQTDAAFERIARKILEAHEHCHLACGSHNVRSVSAVMEMAAAMKVPPERYEFQVLYGMAEPFRNALLREAGRVRLYCPMGQLLPGMAYLIRRLLENSSNESFLRQIFAEGADRETLLRSPQVEAAAAVEALDLRQTAFVNEAAADFSLAAVRGAMAGAIAGVKRQLGRTYPLSIDGSDVKTDDLWDSVNPASPSEVIGRVCQAGTSYVDQAIAAAQKAFQEWQQVPPRERAQYLLRAAAAARERIFELAAWQVLEVGKQWGQAHADVAEAVDYLEYYARQIERLCEPQRLGDMAGERNDCLYEPRGVAAVIAPWNFPLAISCGMSAAAIVTGNCVIYKPSELSPVNGRLLAEIFAKAGLPRGVFNYVPGRREVIGDYLVEHAGISLVAFTGSMQVGLRIIERAAKTREDQACVKRVIAEMGGKNAIIIDDDADLDQAVPAMIQSAFGYAGQKCSACSRVIVLDEVYDRFVPRLVEAAASLRAGPPEDPDNFLGPLVSEGAREKVMRYMEVAGREGTILLSSAPYDDGAGGFYVPLTIVGGIRPEHRIAQEEVFGPLLAVMRAADFEEAIAWANSTPFALTGGLFSRSPRRIDLCRREFRVGDLYINRACTGAMVGRQPFGGLRMSGVGSKSGGPDYLLQFLDARVVTENTMRRGFVPELA